MLDGLIGGAWRLADNDAVRCLVVRGAGKHFHTRADTCWLNEVTHYPPPENFAASLATTRAMQLLNEFLRPTIALVQGVWVSGGGSSFTQPTLATTTASGILSRMTWSILARDPATGTLGVAVASRFFAVGAICPFVEGQVGALATQALVNPMYAIHAMPRLRAGESPSTILASLVSPDEGANQRQFHLIDINGRIAQHTGVDCVSWAGHIAAENVSVAGNMLAGEATIRATIDAYLSASGSMAERLLTAMEAGEQAGGDKRGKQSAGLKVASRDPYPDLDIRADDHPNPLSELRRLYRISRERFAVFRGMLAGNDSAWGVLDRETIDTAIVRDRVPPT